MISIITPAFNAEKYIQRAIESVLSQTYKDWEMIIVDDLSTDKTTQIVSEYVLQDNRIKLITSTHKLYTSGARNLGISVSSGSFLAFLDSDDFWDVNKLTLQHNFMESNEYDFSFTTYQKVDSEGNVIKNPIKARKRVDYNDLKYSDPIGCSTVMLNVKNINPIYFNEKYFYQEDYVLWLDILQKHTRFAYGLDICLGFYRIHSKSKSFNKLKMAFHMWDVLYKDYFKWNIFQKIYFFLYYSCSGIIKNLQ
ncbi:MAG: glycosyltransferase family 2 protein [Spirosomataceae bacterium]